MSTDRAQNWVASIVWNFGRVLGQTGMGLVTNIVLARLLLPEEFGLMAIAAIFLAMADLVATMGMGPAVIQRSELTERHMQVSFTVAVIMAFLFFTLFQILAPAIAEFFRDPRLESIIRVLSIAMAAGTLSSIHRSAMMRNMEFKKLAKIDLASFLFGYAFVSLTLAVLDYGVWSLVIGTVVWMLLTGFLLLRETNISFQLKFHRREFIELYRFGIGVALNNLITFTSLRLDSILIGRNYQVEQLGYYDRAMQISRMPMLKISVTLFSVLFSRYSSIQDDRQQLIVEFTKMVSVAAVALLPILAGAIVAADYVIVGLFGSKWQEAAPIFQYLCAAAMFSSIQHLSGAIVHSTGKVFEEVKQQIITLVFFAIGLYFVIDEGILAIAALRILVGAWLFFAMANLALKILQMPWKIYLGAFIPGIIISMIVSVTAYIVIRIIEAQFALNAELTLVSIVLTLSIVYFACIWYLPFEALAIVKGRLLGKYNQLRSARQA